MQTLCGIAHFDYRIHRAYSYEQAFNVMRALRLSYSEAKQMFRRMVFNVVVRNQDDHTKNISFLMGEDGKWRLSPAYDMGYAYNPNGGWTATHQMSINEKFDNITRDDLLEFASKNNIKDAASVIDDVCEAASHWEGIAKDCGVPSSMIDAIIPNMILGWKKICYLMGHNIELLRKQEKNSRKPSEDLTKYSQKALPCFAENNQKRYRNRNNRFSIELIDRMLKRHFCVNIA